MLNIVLAVAMILGATGQEQVNCGIPGECLGGKLIGIQPEQDYNGCLTMCKDHISCEHFTIFEDTGHCLLFSSCQTIDSDLCTNCISGEKNCQPRQPLCDALGFCVGSYLSNEVTSTSEQCLGLCSSAVGCKWYNFNDDWKSCLLMSSCDSVDDYCSNCFNGEVTCVMQKTEMTQLMVIGGINFRLSDRLDDVEVIDLGADSPTRCFKPTPFPFQTNQQVGGFVDGAPIVCGGRDVTGCWRYMKESDEWRREPYSYLNDLFVEGSAAVILDESIILVTGGNGLGPSSHAIFPRNGTTLQSRGIPTALYWHNLLKINATHLFLVNGKPARTYNSYIYNIEADTWHQTDPIGFADYGVQAGVITLNNGGQEIVNSGGYEHGDKTKIFSLGEMAWRDGPGHPITHLSFAASVQFGDTFLTVGGREGYDMSLGDIYKYNVNNGSWTKLPHTLATPRNLHTAFLIPAGYFDCA